jgi:hypothetical protein
MSRPAKAASRPAARSIATATQPRLSFPLCRGARAGPNAPFAELVRLSHTSLADESASWAIGSYSQTLTGG